MRDGDTPWVALIGEAGSGKDTVAGILGQQYGYTRVAFADEVRWALERLNPTIGMRKLQTHLQEQGWENTKRMYPEVRQLLQRLGTDVIRSLDPDFWVRWAERSALIIGGPIVFTDTRFPNEVEMVRRHGGVVIRVSRSVDHLDTNAPGHISESAWQDIQPDAIILNTVDLPTLFQATHVVMENQILRGARA
jgi:hypothetical protein